MPSSTWMQNNQRYLAANIENTRTVLLEKYKECANNDNGSISNTVPLLKENDEEEEGEYQKPLVEWTEESPPALENICMLFGLSNFERSVVLLCAGVELNAEFAKLCAKVQGDSNATYPTFG